MSLGFVKVSVVATLLGCTLTLTGCADSSVTPAVTVVEAAPAQVTEPLSEAELQDMQTIADHTGQSLADVIAAVAWQNDFGELADQVRTDHPDTFVSSQITGDKQAVITFTQEAPDDLRGLTDAFEAQFGVSERQLATVLGRGDVSVAVRSGVLRRRRRETDLDMSVEHAGQGSVGGTDEKWA